jgi:hypothetical protein
MKVHKIEFLLSAHGVHLAVMDVMYKTVLAAEEQDDEDEVDQERPEDEESEFTEGFLLEQRPADAVLPDLSDSFQETVKKVRLIVKSFRQKTLLIL